MNKYLDALDPVMKRVVAEHGPCPLPTNEEQGAYESLFRAIVYQQLSGKAAGTILKRVLALFDPLLNDIPTAFPSPEAVSHMDDEALRGAGLSWNKIKAIKDLSLKRIEGVVPDLHEIAHLSDDEIVARLISVRGIGRWSVEMYMMFTLGRPDVWPVDDLGVRKGYQLAYGLESMPTPKALMALGEGFRPWRSHAAWYFWREADAKSAKAKEEKK